MATERDERLFAIAQRGIDFEAWKKNEQTQHILADIQRDAELARERCTELSPFTQREELLEAQNDVRMFKALIDKINGYIHQGRAAEQELTKPEIYKD